MKKLTSLLLAVCSTISFVGTLAACSQAHEHTYKTEWSKDETHHWYACEGESCLEVSKKEAHSYGDAVTVDAENHKKSCACGAEITEAHSWDNGKITTIPSANAAGEKTFTCLACGQTKTAPIEYVPDHQVSQKQWIDSFDATLLDNTTLTGYIVDNNSLRISMIIKVSQGDSYEYMKFSETNTLESYYRKTGNTYMLYRKRLTWNNWQTVSNYDFGYSGAAFLSMMPLEDKYQEFTFNAATQRYEAGAMDCTSAAFGTLKYESVTLQYADGRLLSIHAKMRESFKTALEGTPIMEYQFDFTDYGTTMVTFPKFD